MAPKRLPIVSTGRWKNQTASVVMIIAIREPGTLCVIFGHRKTTSKVKIPIARA